MSRRTTAQRAKRDEARVAAKAKALRTKRIKIGAGVSVVAVAIVMLMVSTWPPVRAWLDHGRGLGPPGTRGRIQNLD